MSSLTLSNSTIANTLAFENASAVIESTASPDGSNTASSTVTVLSAVIGAEYFVAYVVFLMRWYRQRQKLAQRAAVLLAIELAEQSDSLGDAAAKSRTIELLKKNANEDESEIAFAQVMTNKALEAAAAARPLVHSPINCGPGACIFWWVIVAIILSALSVTTQLVLHFHADDWDKAAVKASSIDEMSDTTESMRVLNGVLLVILGGFNVVLVNTNVI